MKPEAPLDVNELIGLWDHWSFIRNTMLKMTRRIPTQHQSRKATAKTSLSLVGDVPNLTISNCARRQYKTICGKHPFLNYVPLPLPPNPRSTLLWSGHPGLLQDVLPKNVAPTTGLDHEIPHDEAIVLGTSPSQLHT